MLDTITSSEEVRVGLHYDDDGEDSHEDDHEDSEDPDYECEGEVEESQLATAMSIKVEKQKEKKAALAEKKKTIPKTPKAPKTPKKKMTDAEKEVDKAEKKKQREAERRRIAQERWKEDYQFANAGLKEKIDSFQPAENAEVFALDAEDMNAVDMFELFFDDEVVNFICEMTNKYALANNVHSGSVEFKKEECRCFLGIVLLSGYNERPSNRMFWEEKPDVRCDFVKDAMRRNRFLEILRYLHFCDNDDLDLSDKITKIRPLFDMLNSRYRKFAQMTKSLNIDESMVEYFGKFGHALKQRMKLKPIRSGYKLWCLNLDNGYLYTFEVYQGAGSQSQYQAEYGHGPGVVLGLMDHLPEGNWELYLDNFFTSIKLFKHLADRGIGVTGTFGKQMMEGALLAMPSENSEEVKGVRGKFASFVDQSSEVPVQITRWLDNKMVHVGSNYLCDTPPGVCKRWSKPLKDYIILPRPNSIGNYNEHMGGTDQMDQSLNTYKPIVRNKKWYWALFIFGVQSAMYNAWLLLRSSRQEEPFLSFIREVATHYLTVFKTQ